MTQFKRWDEYTKEAAKPPFELPVSDAETLLVESPTGGQVIDVQRAFSRNDLEEILRIMCGVTADRILELVRPAPVGAMNALVEDMMRHFGLDPSGEQQASSG